MEMVAGLSRATEPSDVLHEFAKGFQKLYGPQGYVSLSTRGLQGGKYKITRLITEDVPGNIGKADPWKKGSDLPIHTKGFLGRIISRPEPQVYHHLDLADDPVVGDALAQYRSMMAIPLFDNGEPLNWSITLRPEPDAFTLAELEDTILRANLGGATIRNTIVTNELRDANVAIENELEQIAKIQRALLPKKLPDIPGVDLDVSYEMFDQAGGDMYALRPLRVIGDPTARPERLDPDGPWGVLIADVSGHGAAAAVVMAMMQSIIETYPHEPQGPAELLEYANYHLSTKRI